MKNDASLGSFITFILLAAVPKNPSTAAGNFTYIQLAIPQFLPLARFLELALDRIRKHELLARPAHPAQLVFRFGTSH